jgi:hypothetical protein
LIARTTAQMDENISTNAIKQALQSLDEMVTTSTGVFLDKNQMINKKKVRFFDSRDESTDYDTLEDFRTERGFRFDLPHVELAFPGVFPTRNYGDAKSPRRNILRDPLPSPRGPRIAQPRVSGVSLVAVGSRLESSSPRKVGYLSRWASSRSCPPFAGFLPS